MLRTKCILEPPSPEDGRRISVASRHTENDGITPREVAPYDIHIPELGPSPKLIGPYLREEITWEEFAERYTEEIRAPDKRPLIQALVRDAIRGIVTLLCFERKGENCHRILLAQECQRYGYGLEVTHI